MKRWLPFLLSLGLTFALTAGIVTRGPARRRTAPPPAPDAAPVPAPPTPTPRPDTVPASAPPPAPAFHWSQIESADYRVYLANLRALGMPERLVRDLIVAEVEQLYRTRSYEPPRYTPPWQPAAERRAQARTARERQAALTGEEQALLRELLGFAWDAKAIEAWQDEPTAWLVLGYLDEVKPPQLMTLIETYEDRGRSFRAARDHLLLPEDWTGLHALHTALQRDLASVLAPVEREEFDLRLQAVFSLMRDSDEFLGVTVTGAELREIMRLGLRRGDPLWEAVLEGGDESTEAEKEQRQARFRADVARLLGPGRAEDYARAADHEYRQVLRFTGEQHLPKATAIRAHEVRRAAALEAEAVKRDTTLTPNERGRQLEAILAVTSRSLEAALGSAAYTDYARQQEGWFKDLVRVTDPAKDPAP